MQIVWLALTPTGFSTTEVFHLLDDFPEALFDVIHARQYEFAQTVLVRVRTRRTTDARCVRHFRGETGGHSADKSVGYGFVIAQVGAQVEHEGGVLTTTPWARVRSRGTAHVWNGPGI